MLTSPVAILWLHGNYTGQGRQIDIQSNSKQYTISQAFKLTDNKVFITYQHTFNQETNTLSNEMELEFISAEVFKVSMQGVAVGHGYIFADYLHFSFKQGDTYIETSYHKSDKHIRVRGSSNSPNSDSFMAWTELLIVE